MLSARLLLLLALLLPAVAQAQDADNAPAAEPAFSALASARLGWAATELSALAAVQAELAAHQPPDTALGVAARGAAVSHVANTGLLALGAVPLLVAGAHPDRASFEASMALNLIVEGTSLGLRLAGPIALLATRKGAIERGSAAWRATNWSATVSFTNAALGAVWAWLVVPGVVVGKSMELLVDDVVFHLLGPNQRRDDLRLRLSPGASGLFVVGTF